MLTATNMDWFNIRRFRLHDNQNFANTILILDKEPTQMGKFDFQYLEELSGTVEVKNAYNRMKRKNPGKFVCKAKFDFEKKEIIMKKTLGLTKLNYFQIKNIKNLKNA